MDSFTSFPHPPTIVILHGDQTGEELLQETLRVLDADVIGYHLTFRVGSRCRNARNGSGA
jgi:isocitrate/isopropylmalate dehydrogenase